MDCIQLYKEVLIIEEIKDEKTWNIITQDIYKYPIPRPIHNILSTSDLHSRMSLFIWDSIVKWMLK